MVNNISYSLQSIQTENMEVTNSLYGSSTGEIIYSERILIIPNINSDSTIFLQWATIIHLLGGGKTTLSGLFNFEPITKFNDVCQKVDLHQWKNLHLACEEYGILPLISGTNNNHLPKPKSKPNMFFNQTN